MGEENMRRSSIGLLALLILSSSSCGGATEEQCAGGEQYPAEEFASNTAAERGLAERLGALVAPLKNVDARPTREQLKGLFEAGTPSLASITAPEFAATLPAYFAAAEEAAGGTWMPADPPVDSGGWLGGYLFSNRGVDLKEAVEKGLFGAAHYHQAVKLMAGDVSPATVDRILALFGTSPAFPMNDKAAENPDAFSAKYAKRRTDPAASKPGIYLVIKRAFIDARAASTRGAACLEQRDAALAAIRTEWERALAGTVVYYLSKAAGGLETPNATPEQRAAALHEYNEAVGFLKGLRTVAPGARKMTDAQLDELLATLLAPMGAAPESHRLLLDGVANVPRLTQAVRQIQTAWGFTADEIASFKVNY
jgi:hypothetical protein